MKTFYKKQKLSNLLILVGISVIILNVFFIVLIDPYLLEKRIANAWTISEDEIRINNNREFETSELNLELITANDLLNEIDETKIIGFISIPNVDLSLPLLRGATPTNLDVTAATIMDEQTMGVGNYPVAGHRTVHPDTLFSPLNRVEVDDEIYLTDKQAIYIYKVHEIDIVTPEQIEVLNPPSDGAIVTLITCSGKNSEFRRIVVGKLIEVNDFNEGMFTQYFR